MTKDTKIFTSIVVCSIASTIIIGQYNANKDRALKAKKLENEKLYFSKLSSEQVESLEKQKLDLKKSEIELKMNETEMKKTVADFKSDVVSKIMTNIDGEMRSTFDDWSSKYEDRLDNKVDRIVSRIDDLSDKYGGVKQGSTSPSISVVNAPNN